MATYEKEKDQLGQDLALLANDRDTALLNAENERQTLLGMAQQEKNGLVEKLNAHKDEIARLSGEHEKVKRESSLKQEQDKNLLLSLQVGPIDQLNIQFKSLIS